MWNGNFSKPEATREYPHGHTEVVRIGAAQILRNTFEPGWQWSKDIGSSVHKTICDASHTIYVQQGHVRVRVADGSEKDLHAGEVAYLAPNHDAWVVGNETAITIDFQDMIETAKKFVPKPE